ncbi:N-acetylmuramoyl-L-alanine amidase [Paucibacter sp. APW11]|uniref:N-acetylmuramoyl-L-alanine amidase n=1 Tax=Roseateles aquae TaxID=3077235 RepID=A0ABU3PIA6_9BURK|nr:N-acetylmuramoyl-L-alanine amidase [Paucibacter sp. APW11]MDT9001852.1 N-acetylmuramoyl-L-alanine amidase [Paucibacter sp. APW11]
MRLRLAAPASLATFPARFPATLLVATLMLAGCATAPPQGVRIDTRYVSENQDSRVLFLVLHYTVGDFESSLKTLTTGGKVSAHYLVRDEPVTTYRLVDESRRAWHAGVSYWRGSANINPGSIGIEIVNPGRLVGADGTVSYAPYPDKQIDEVIQLCKEIVARHQIRPERIVGHSDIQPQSKQDPGPMFPWKRLWQAGLIAWPDEAMVAERRPGYELSLPDVAWFQAKLARHGFDVPRNGELDRATRNVIAAFQMKYRPARYDGEPDAETAALLEVATLPEGMRMVRPQPAPAAEKAP